MPSHGTGGRRLETPPEEPNGRERVSARPGRYRVPEVDANARVGSSWRAITAATPTSTTLERATQVAEDRRLAEDRRRREPARSCDGIMIGLRNDGLTNLMETSTNTRGPMMIRLAPSARPFPHTRHSSTRMSLLLRAALPALVLIGVSACAPASTGSSDVAPRVVDVPTRPGVIQRFVLLSPREPKATVVLFAGDHGGLQIAAGPRFTWGAGGLADNFLMRSRQL